MRVTIDFDEGSSPLSGSVRIGDSALPFVGILELLVLLERMRDAERGVNEK